MDVTKLMDESGNQFCPPHLSISSFGRENLPPQQRSLSSTPPVLRHRAVTFSHGLQLRRPDTALASEPLKKQDTMDQDLKKIFRAFIKSAHRQWNPVEYSLTAEVLGSGSEGEVRLCAHFLNCMIIIRVKAGSRGTKFPCFGCVSPNSWSRPSASKLYHLLGQHDSFFILDHFEASQFFGGRMNFRCSRLPQNCEFASATF
jgi:hypothetical protein